MPLSLTLASLWIIAASCVAMLPMRWQFIVGIPMLVMVPPLLWFVGHQVGWIWVTVIAVGLASMFRRPLWSIARHVTRRFGKGAA
jgi:hypothetical protein